jgi:hypothetical protein
MKDSEQPSTPRVNNFLFSMVGFNPNNHRLIWGINQTAEVALPKLVGHVLRGEKIEEHIFSPLPIVLTKAEQTASELQKTKIETLLRTLLDERLPFVQGVVLQDPKKLPLDQLPINQLFPNAYDGGSSASQL